MDLGPDDVSEQVRHILGRDLVVTGVRNLWQPRLASTRGVYRVDVDDARGELEALAWIHR